jgi:hypothetical protein
VVQVPDEGVLGKIRKGLGKIKVRVKMSAWCPIQRCAIQAHLGRAFCAALASMPQEFARGAFVGALHCGLEIFFVSLP